MARIRSELEVTTGYSSNIDIQYGRLFGSTVRMKTEIRWMPVTATGYVCEPAPKEKK